MKFIDISTRKPLISDCGRDFLVKIKISRGFEYQVAEWFNHEDGETEPSFLIKESWCGQQVIEKEVVEWLDFTESPTENRFAAYQTFLKEAVNELLKAERSIVKDGFVKLSIDEEYRCSDSDLAKYKIEYSYPLHLIHLGQDLHRAELRLNDDVKRKWFIR